MELWKKINNTNYYISNFGNFKKCINGKEIMLTGWIDRVGYKLISFMVNNKRMRYFTHRIVAEYFVKKQDKSYTIVNHIDGNKLNNFSSNLEWTTYSGNRVHAVNILNVGKRMRAVTLYDKYDNEIKKYSSISIASRELNIPHSKIYEVCNKIRNRYKTYYFKYTATINIKNTKETWKTINGYGNKYEVSDFGNIRNVKTFKNPRLLKNNKIGGYMYVYLYHNNKQTNHFVHRLVAQTFIPNPKNLSDVNHIDHNKENNKLSNLEWLSHKDNCNK